MALLSDEEVGIGDAGGLQSDEDVGLRDPSKPWGGFNIGPSPETVRNAVEPVLNAFGQGFREGWGPERLGLKDEDVKWLAKAGIFAPEGSTRYNSPFHAFNELLAQTIYTAPEILFRGGAGLFRGAQVAGMAAGLPRDVVAIPEAFFGSPHPMGIPKMRSGPGIVPDEAPAGINWDRGTVGKNLPLPEGMTVIDVPVKALDEAFKRTDKEFYVDKPKQEVIDYAASGEPMSLPEVGVDKGRIGFTNGRNRFAAARDMGEETLPVAVEADNVPDLLRALDDADQRIDLPQARDLGVIGPDRPSIAEGTAGEAAAAATRSAEEQARPNAPPEKPKDGGYDWQARFDHFVGKLEAPKDVKRLIHNAAGENESFPAARQGDIPLQHVESIAEAAGVEPSEVNARGLGRTLRNDAEVRIAMRLMMQATDNVKTLARDVVADASEQNLIKFQEAILRRDMSVEQIVGLRAEWGRTGNVFQEFMREVKDGEALDSFLKDKCPL